MRQMTIMKTETSYNFQQDALSIVNKEQICDS